MNLFNKKSKRVVGVDIGTHSIKLIELAGNRASPKVVSWGAAKLPAGAFTDNTISNAEQITETLTDIINRAGVDAQSVAISISSSHAITKVLSMPADLSETEMEEQVSIEAVHFIPYPIDEVNIDFEVLGPSETNPEEEVDVLLVACRRSIVDSYIDLVEDLGYDLRYVDIDTYAIERVYRNQYADDGGSEQPVALFDIGYTTSHLMVLDGERVIYSRHQSFGASQLIKMIRKEYGLNAEEAEEILLSSNPPGDFLATVQEPFVNILNQEINRALQFFYSSSSFSNIDRLFLLGGCSRLSGLAQDLEEKMRTRVTVMDIFKGVALGVGSESLAQSEGAMSTAFGLSLRGLD